jgi:hypothetical protein
LVILFIIGVLTQLSPLVLYFVFFKKIYKISELRVIFLYVLVSTISNGILGRLKNYAALIISIFAIFEFIIFSMYFYLSIQNKKAKKIILTISTLNVVLEFFLFYFYRQHFDFWVALMNTVIVVFYAILFFYEQINEPQPMILYQSYKFWIAVGCIIYLSGTLFLFLYTSDLKDKQTSSLWFINIAFEVVKNVCFSIAFIIAGKKKQNTLASELGNTNILEKPF